MRPTLRCLNEDLGIGLPGVDVDLSTIEFDLASEALRLAPESPKGQKRILSVGERPVFRIQRADRRGATWLDRDAGVLWVLAIGPRRDGADDDLYEHVKALSESPSRLFPTPDDYRRDQLEATTRWLARARGDIAAVVGRTRISPQADVPALLCGRIRVFVRLEVAGGVEEWWVAVRFLDKELGNVSERERNVIFALFEEEVQAEVWEYQPSWPGREPTFFEVVRLGLRG